jgi:fumarate reductase subunit C
MPASWFTRKGHYFWYVVREFTALPLALWLLWLLVEVQRASNGPAGYAPHASAAFIAFSVVVLLFALYHSVTFLSLSGLIIRIKVLDRTLHSRLVTATMFGLWALASVVIAAALIGFAR